eukprot:scaffold16_cov242-Pinguiococcus_pyrenoidosus.AAC.19
MDASQLTVAHGTVGRQGGGSVGSGVFRRHAEHWVRDSPRLGESSHNKRICLQLRQGRILLRSARLIVSVALREERDDAAAESECHNPDAPAVARAKPKQLAFALEGSSPQHHGKDLEWRPLRRKLWVLGLLLFRAWRARNISPTENSAEENERLKSTQIVTATVQVLHQHLQGIGKSAIQTARSTSCLLLLVSKQGLDEQDFDASVEVAPNLSERPALGALPNLLQRRWMGPSLVKDRRFGKSGVHLRRPRGRLSLLPHSVSQETRGSWAPRVACVRRGVPEIEVQSIQVPLSNGLARRVLVRRAFLLVVLQNRQGHFHLDVLLTENPNRRRSHEMGDCGRLQRTVEGHFVDEVRDDSQSIPVKVGRRNPLQQVTNEGEATDAGQELLVDPRILRKLPQHLHDRSEEVGIRSVCMVYSTCSVCPISSICAIRLSLLILLDVGELPNCGQVELREKREKGLDSAKAAECVACVRCYAMHRSRQPKGVHMTCSCQDAGPSRGLHILPWPRRVFGPFRRPRPARLRVSLMLLPSCADFGRPLCQGIENQSRVHQGMPRIFAKKLHLLLRQTAVCGPRDGHVRPATELYVAEG